MTDASPECSSRIPDSDGVLKWDRTMRHEALSQRSGSFHDRVLL